MRAIYIVVVCSVAMAASADEKPMESHEHHTASTAGYTPGLGEIMTLQQMRHAKLWLAGNQKNWPLADYELDELREGFEDLQKLHPIHDGVPVGAMAQSLTAAPLESIGKAIEAKNAAGFAKSFDQLTAACNACHRAAKHGFIVITRPAASAFPNQKFSP